MTVCKLTEISSAYITHCGPDPDHAPAHVPVSAWALGWCPCLAVVLPDPDILALVDHAALAALATACDLELPDVSVVEKLGLLAEYLYLPFAATVSAGWPNSPAGAAQNAAYHAACHLFLQTFPVFPAELVLFVLLAPDSVAVLQGHAVDNDNSAVEAAAAVPFVEGNGPLNIAAGKQATVRVPEQHVGPIYPNHVDAAPNRGPSDAPNVAAHRGAIQKNTRVADGSSARGFAKRRQAQTPDSPAPKVRCTRNWHTSYRPGKPSTCCRKRRSLLPVAARSRRGNQVRGQVVGMLAG